MVFSCLKCNEDFLNKRNLKYHHANIKCIPNFICKPCDKTFANKQSLTIHQASKIHYKTVDSFISKKKSSVDNIDAISNYPQTKPVNNKGMVVLIDSVNKFTKEILYTDALQVFLCILKFNSFSVDAKYHHIYISNKRTNRIHIKENDTWIVKNSAFSLIVVKNIALYIKSLLDYHSRYNGDKTIKTKKIEIAFTEIVNNLNEADQSNKILKIFSKAILLALYENRYKCLKFADSMSNIDLDFKFTSCLTHLCDSQAKDNYRGYCTFCFINLFPDEPVSRNYKIKEQRVIEFIKEQFPEESLVLDKTITGGCSRRRPDCYIERLTHNIIIECDENQHSSKEYTSCDNKRTMELFQDSGVATVFIRFNPDKYKVDNKTIKSCFKVCKATGLQIISNIKEWETRLETLKETVDFWINNIPEKEVTIINLFFNEN